MSWLKFAPLDRWSPFTRSPPQGSTTVNDTDFSYITNEDLQRHVTNNEPEAETDILTLRDRRNEYTIHFPANSIARGELRVEAVREAAAKRMNLSPARVKLTYKGRSLKDDRIQCRAEGLKAGVKILCSKEESEFLSDEDSLDEVEGEKKKRIRNRNKKKRGGRQDVDDDKLGVPEHLRAPASGASTGTSTPLTAKEKIAKLRDTLDSFDQDVQGFLKHPPNDRAKREFDRKRISETILTQVLLKTDAIEVEGDQAARQSRKDLVKDVQSVLRQLDEAHGGLAA